jgi:hypothetical protein
VGSVVGLCIGLFVGFSATSVNMMDPNGMHVAAGKIFACALAGFVAGGVVDIIRD